MADTYDNKIDEFVDWAGDESTGGLPVKGGRIRELLQGRLRSPFYLYYDIEAKLYRIFSSESSFTKWNERAEYPDENQEREALELFNFTAPSPYTINLYETGTNTQLVLNNRYIRSGVRSDNTVLRFDWSILTDESEISDAVIVTVTVSNGGTQSFSTYYSSNKNSADIDLYDYLKDGSNVVSVTITGEKIKASKTVSFTIDMIRMSFSSTFDFATRRSGGNLVNFNVRLNSTGSYVRYIQYLDGEYDSALLPDDKVTASENVYSVVKSVTLPSDIAEGKHTLQIVAYCNIEGQMFYSNTLYYEFVVTPTSAVTEQYVLVAASLDDIVDGIVDGEPELSATQYSRCTVTWGYTSNSASIDSKEVEWLLVSDTQEISLSTITATRDQEADSLVFVPSVCDEDGAWSLKAVTPNGTEYSYAISIAKFDEDIQDTSGYALNLNATGKSNTDKTWTYGDYEAVFSGFRWNSLSGWDDNALVVAEGTSVDIDYNPFSESSSNAISEFGRTVEIEFSTFNIGDSTKEIARIGNSSGGGYISITPNSAALVSASGTEIIKTNFKDRERTRLCFIVNPKTGMTDDVDNNLVFIVNNGILERVNSLAGYTLAGTSGNIHIGGESSGVRIYSIRCYEKYISVENAFANYALNSDGLATILKKNAVYDTDRNIDFDLVKVKTDTILITGPLDYLLDLNADGEAAKGYQIAADVQRICVADTDKNFIIKNCRIRKHGQSTLNYPVPSFKIWSGSDFTASAGLNGTGLYSTDSTLVDNDHLIAMYKASSYDDCTAGNKIYKGRYQMKDGCVPAKKWVLQANYADSSGTHNGSLQRLMQSCWYEAVINSQYKLRTPPQLFSSNERTDDFFGNELGKVWNDYNPDVKFPYTLRISPDSFPVVVFWRSDENSEYQFLGQYVFMDDKKSDFIYGERSIYNVAKDPFCLLEANKSKDTSANRIWDNDNVLRLEVLNIDTPFVDYRSMTDSSGQDFEAVLEDNTYGQKYAWEGDFELVYPDKDDITSKDSAGNKAFDFTKFTARTKPFVDWYKWLVGTYQNHDTFRAEAADHIDLYKMAAYYIFVLRFGLVDSLERNAQIKTYDGTLFWYEPWDMDIALGNRNTGGIAFDPPIDRNTTDGSEKYAISGRTPNTSNWLFDALEAWPDWIDGIVPKVARALNDAGLTYDNIVTMFDDNYASAWCERIYNHSGHYKYIENGGGSYFPWCQGARTTHRHWWLKNSMDYYDAKWGTGSFIDKAVYIAGTHNVQTSDSIEQYGKDTIGISGSTSTYFSLGRESSDNILATLQSKKYDGTDSTVEHFDISSIEVSPKTPIYLYGASYIQYLDLSKLSAGLSILKLDSCYDEETGANLKVLNIGVPVERMIGSAVFNNVESFTISDGSSHEAVTSIETLNIQGYKCITGGGSFGTTLSYMDALRQFYAIGSGLTSFTGVTNGATYDVLQLPSTIYQLSLNNSSWETNDWTADEEPSESTGLTFWSTVMDDSESSVTITKCGSVQEDLKIMELTGTTGLNACTRTLVMAWIDAIEAGGWDYGERTLVMDNINWSGNSAISYETLMRLAKFNQGKPEGNFKGYIMLTDTDLTDTQLQNIQTLFGDSVFIKNSSGLVVDYSTTTILLTVGSPAYLDDEGNLCVEEGYNSDGTPVRCLLTATKFLLSDETRDQTWYINVGGVLYNVGDSYCGAYISQIGEYFYLNVPDMTDTSVDEIMVQVIDDEFPDSPITKSIKVTHKVYPQSLDIKAVNSSGVECTATENGYVLNNIGVYYAIPQFSYPDGTEAEQTSFLWSYDSADNIVIEPVTRTDAIGDYTFSSDTLENNVLKITQNRTPDASDVVSLDISLSMVYKSGKSLTKSETVHVDEDPDILTSTGNPGLYKLFYQWYLMRKDDSTYEYGVAAPTSRNTFSKYSLKGCQHFPDASAMSGTDYGDNLMDISSFNCGDYNIFEYIPNCEVIDLTGTTLYDAMEDTDNVIDISGCTSLDTFESTTGCTLICEGVSQSPSIYLYSPVSITVKNSSLGMLVMDDVSSVTTLIMRDVTINSSSKTLGWFFSYFLTGETSNLATLDVNSGDEVSANLQQLLYLSEFTTSAESALLNLEGTVNASEYYDNLDLTDSITEKFPLLTVNLTGTACVYFKDKYMRKWVYDTFGTESPTVAKVAQKTFSPSNTYTVTIDGTTYNLQDVVTSLDEYEYFNSGGVVSDWAVLETLIYPRSSFKDINQGKADLPKATRIVWPATFENAYKYSLNCPKLTTMVFPSTTAPDCSDTYNPLKNIGSKGQVDVYIPDSAYKETPESDDDDTSYYGTGNGWWEMLEASGGSYKFVLHPISDYTGERPHTYILE